MEFKLVLFLFSFIFANIIYTVRGACVFPSDLEGGTWRSTRWDDIVFTADEMTIPDYDGSPLTFACDTQSGSKYLIRSTVSKLVLTNLVEIVACLDFRSSTSGVKHIYYHATAERSLPGGLTHPVRLIAPGSSMTTSDICTVTSYTTGTNDVMIKVDRIAESVIKCPTPLLADFDDYIVTDAHSGNSSCGGTGYIHICDDSKTVIVEYSVCSKMIFYSTGGNLSCVYYSSSGSTYYANLLNNDASVDNSESYHYACLAVKKSGGVWYASQWPRKCTDTQTPTSVPSSVGYTFTLNANLTCVPGSSSSFNIIPIIVAVAVVLIGGGLAYYFCVVKKKGKKLKKKMPCFKKNKKKGKVNPTSPNVSISTAPMDGKKTGLQATAVFTGDRSSTITPLPYSRNLETAQSTRSAITVSHMTAELLDDDQTPRRLPPLMPQPPNNHQESDTSDTPSIPPARLPPISEHQMGASGAAGDQFNASSISTSAVNPSTIRTPSES